MSDTLVVVLTFIVSYASIGSYAVYLHLRLRKARG